MPTLIPAGPYKHLTTVEGVPFPYYVIPFDEDGVCVGPQTLKHLLDHADGYSDIFVFSHGWNNDWSAATARYDEFIRGFQEMRRSLNLAMPGAFRPLLVGIFWPSQALEWFESETGPRMASQDAAPSPATDIDRRVLGQVASGIATEARGRFFELAQSQLLSEAEASEFADLLASIQLQQDEELGELPPLAADLLVAAEAIGKSVQAGEPDYDAVGVADGDVGEAKAALSLGGILRTLDPRNILKPFTVWQMKDRAGKVGRGGVRDLLQRLLSNTEARVHLLGHSYGCKVVMTAVARLEPETRLVQSAVLFQPAVSQYAFADVIPTKPGFVGGFEKTLRQVKAPIVCTFSDNDAPLTKLFHLALRRSDDLGEGADRAAGLAPSKYCALGGYGPQNTVGATLPIQDEGQPYDLSEGGRLLALNGTRTINGHGDISSQSTWWLAYAAATSA